ncbi:MAG: DUF4340 domain-containing protein [Planctomycetota bacterium]|nr:DUF4340 domain-containing protein [Planctomycetota bacterium]
MSTSSAGNSNSNGKPQNNNRRTIMFVGVAVACLAITFILKWANSPKEIQEFGKVGEEFYPKFTDPTVATALAVKVIDSDNLKPLEFSVEQASNGQWVIPSHHNYPADAADQLAKTASSVIGIKRDAMVTRWDSDHPQYGVVDPETDSVSVDEIDGIGKRLTFRGTDDKILASFIIGKKVEDQENRYYVRHPGEDETYIAELDIDLSTKFGDWVKTDLLDVQGSDILRIDLQDYSFEERGMQLAVTDTIETELSRDSSTDDWTMKGLDVATKQVNAEAIAETVNAVADLAIAGVRPKQPGLTGDLELDRSVIASQRDVDRIQADLLARGFLLQPSTSDPKQLRLIAREGELSVGTNDGLVYQLHFGRAFTGSDEELEIGFSSNGDTEASSEEDADQPDAKDATGDSEAEGSDSEAEETPSGKPGRYVYVRVQVDPSLLGDKPNPVEPQKPAELIEADKEAAEASESESEEGAPQGDTPPDAETAEATETGEEASSDDDGETPEGESEEAKEARLQQLREAFAQIEQQYEADKRALVEYEEKVKAAEEKAVELNRRFALWYYVIPGDEYDNLTLTKEDLISAITAEDGTPVGEPLPELQLNLPSADAPGLPIQAPAGETQPASSEDPESTASEAPGEKPEPAPEPTPEPAPEPTAEPAPEATAEPAPEPTPEPAPEPTAEPAP